MLTVKRTLKLMVMAAIAASPTNVTKAQSKTLSGHKGNYRQYFDTLSMKESSNRYHAINQKGYLGKYQMGEMALTQAGFYKTHNNKYHNHWKGNWSHNITGKSDFLNDQKMQERAVRIYTSENWRLIKHYHLDKFIGTIHNGIEITTSGLLAGAHLVGVGGLRKFLLEGEDVTDGNNTPVSEYIIEMAGYHTPFHNHQNSKKS